MSELRSTEILEQLHAIQGDHTYLPDNISATLEASGWPMQTEWVNNFGKHDTLYVQVYAPNSDAGTEGVMLLRSYNHAAYDSDYMLSSSPAVILREVTTSKWLDADEDELHVDCNEVEDLGTE